MFLAKLPDPTALFVVTRFIGSDREEAGVFCRPDRINSGHYELIRLGAVGFVQVDAAALLFLQQLNPGFQSLDLAD